MKRTNTAVWLEQYGRWQIKVQKDGQRRTFSSSTSGRTGQREANAKADAWLDDGITAGQRVSVLWERFLESCDMSPAGTPERQKGPNYKKIKATGESYILPHMGHLKIDNVTEGVLQSLVNKAYKTGSLKKGKKQRKPANLPLSKKTLLGIIEVEKKFIKYCRKIERVTTLNPEDLAPPDGARLKGKSILQPDSLSVLFSVDTTIHHGRRVPDPYIYAYRFQVASGLRPGELLGLCVGDISISGEVNIKRSINSNGMETKGKNQNAIRSFIMSPQASEAYRAQMELLRSSGIAINLSTPLFQIHSQSSYYARWKRYLVANGLPHLSPYELRHTFVSIVKNLPDGQVRTLVGHSRSMDTFGVYGHALNGEAQETAREVGGIFDKLLKAD